MGSSKDKGDRTERQARNVYERAGYAVESPNYTRYENTDYFNLFDFMAMRPGYAGVPGDFRMVQVKSNQARGRPGWIEQAATWTPRSVAVDFVVRYDREGYTLAQPDPSAGPREWYYRVDERDEGCNIGERLKEFLTY